MYSAGAFLSPEALVDAMQGAERGVAENAKVVHKYVLDLAWSWLASPTIWTQLITTRAAFVLMPGPYITEAWTNGLFFPRKTKLSPVLTSRCLHTKSLGLRNLSQSVVANCSRARGLLACGARCVLLSEFEQFMSSEVEGSTWRCLGTRTRRVRRIAVAGALLTPCQ